MAAHPQPARVALVVHPTRSIAAPLETLGRWAGQHGLEIVQIPAVGGGEREVALRDLSFEELDAMWDTAKAEERQAAAGGRT